MKRILLITLLFAAFTSQAQVKFKPGFRAGANFAKFTDMSDVFFGDEEDDPEIKRQFRTDFYAGISAGIKFSKRYTLQPEVTYSRQGSILKQTFDQGATTKAEPKISYISVAVINKLYPGRKFNIEVGPYFDQAIEDNFDPDIKFDFGIIVGAGYDITDHLGVEARLKKGVPSVYDGFDWSYDNFVLSVGLTYSIL